MITVAEFELQLERALVAVKPELVVGLERVGTLAATLAAHFIGHEMEGWPPLKPSTIADKERKGYAVPAPLLRTGQMRDSIGHRVDPVELELVVGATDRTAVYQEIGTSRIPPRPFLGRAMHDAMPFATDTFGAVAVKLLTGKRL